MNCPRCKTPMVRNARTNNDGKTLTANYLCTACMKRVVKVEPNPIMALESKTPMPTIIHNPHTNRKGKIQLFSEIRSAEAAMRPEGNGQ